MKSIFLRIFIPVTLIVSALLIVGSGCFPESFFDGFGDIWYRDLDGDGFGNWDDTFFSDGDTLVTGYVKEPGDCDDTDPTIHKDAVEVPDNLIDENCNGEFAFTFYLDNDNDGFGDPMSPLVVELESYDDAAPEKYSWFAGDCNDKDPLIHPKADEIIGNEIDDNCDGLTDIVEFYVDADRDGYGSNIVLPPGEGGVSNSLDCDDRNDDIYPFQKEILDNRLDDNCDGVID